MSMKMVKVLNRQDLFNMFMQRIMINHHPHLI